MLSFVLLFSTLSQSIVATTVYAGNILMMEVALEGRMDSATAPGFEKEIFQKLDGVTELVLDFTDLAYLSSAGLRVLLSCQKKMNAAKGSMVVKHVNEIIMEVFEATGFDSILTVEQ